MDALVRNESQEKGSRGEKSESSVRASLADLMDQSLYVDCDVNKCRDKWEKREEGGRRKEGM